ncbi:MAG TPA: AAA family ATPase [Thermomicrobiales bacterium]|nr:AAA family ATPase [Thermomicrobiales bacterium]
MTSDTLMNTTVPKQDMLPTERPARVVAFVNQKGGVGKTTSTVNIASVLAGLGDNVLVVDIDPQGNATSSFGVEKQALDITLYDALMGDVDTTDAIIPGARERIDLLPAIPMLAGAEVELVDQPRREYRLADAVAHIRSNYDVVLIDSPPSLGLLTVNALTAADAVVIPVQCEYLALEGVSQVLATIDLVRRNLNPDLELIGVLMTMYDGRTRLSSHVVDEVRRYFPDHLFSVVIPRSVRLAEAPSFGQVIGEYDPSSRGAAAYAEVARELRTRLAATR